MKSRALLPIVCLAFAGACSSASADRPQVPDRPEVPRPEGIEPEGLSEVRDAMAEQRSAARERSNALMTEPNELSTDDGSPWYEPIIWAMEQARHIIGKF